MTKVVYNAGFGEFNLSNKALDRMVELGYVGLELNSNEIPRHHPILVQVVEELGDKASGDYSILAIVEVYGPYRIDEYDGSESVMTVGDYDWVTP